MASPSHEATGICGNCRNICACASRSRAPVATGRDLRALSAQIETSETPKELEAWDAKARSWRRSGLTSWKLDDLPEKIEITSVGGIPVFGFPGLRAEEASVSLLLFKSRDEAEAASREALMTLGELELHDEVAWLQRELRELDEYRDLFRPLGSPAEMRKRAYQHLRLFVFDREEVFPLTGEAFRAGLEKARERLQGLSLAFIDVVADLLGVYHEGRLYTAPYPGMDQDLARLVPADFPVQIPYAKLSHGHRSPSSPLKNGLS